MKKTFILAMAAFMCLSCAAKKQVAQQPAPQPVQQESETQKQIRELKEQQELQRIKNEMEKEQAQHDREMAEEARKISTYEFPCMDKSYDDDIYFRELGVGTVEGGNIQLARQNAAEGAKNLIKIRLGEYVEGITDFYYESYSGNSDKAAAADRTRRKLNGIVQEKLNNADKECELTGVDGKGIEHAYYVVRIPKGELNKEIEKVLNEEAKLRTDFNAAEMQKFMDERMAAMKAAKKEAGY